MAFASISASVSAPSRFSSQAHAWSYTPQQNSRSASSPELPLRSPINNAGVRAAKLGFLFIDLNSYFASCEQQLNACLRGKPVAVVPVDSDFTCAIAASYEAKAYGIKTGTLIYEAKQRCPGLICVPAQHKVYVEFHEKIIKAVEQVLPIDKIHSIDEFSCRLLENEQDPNYAITLAKLIKQSIADHVGPELRCSIGLAPNRFLAKVATEIEKPDGLVALLPHDMPGRLFDLQIRDLPGVGYNMQRRLMQAGVNSMRQLWQCSADELRRVWGGVVGEQFWYMLHGEELPPSVTHRRSIGHSHVLDPSQRGQTQAFWVGRRLGLKAASRLRRLDYYASHLYLSVRLEKGGRWSGEAKLRHTQDSFTLMAAFDSLWRKLIAQHPQARLKKVSIVLGQLCTANQLTPDLFDTLQAQTKNSMPVRADLWKALDRINARWGKDTVTLGQAVKRSDLTSKIAFSRIPDVEEFWE